MNVENKIIEADNLVELSPQEVLEKFRKIELQQQAAIWADGVSPAELGIKNLVPK